MTFRWDPAKARRNLQKHGIDFADAVGALEDPNALTIDDPHPTEPRWVTLALDAFGRVLVVCWTLRGDAIRIISARRATHSEIRKYHEET